MKSVRAFLAGLFVIFAVASASAQVRQVELRVSTPVKKDIQAEQTEVGGMVYLPVGNFTVVGKVGYQQATNLFFAPDGSTLDPVDTLNAGGDVWYYFTGREKTVAPFVTGGIARAAFLGQNDSTQAITGFGLTIHKGDTYVIPQFQFASDDLEDGRTILGKSYKVTIPVMIPLSSTFNFNVTPEIGRVQIPAIAGYDTQVKLNLGFSIKR